MYKDQFSVKTNLKQLFLQQYERYLPTAFDESLSLVQKMNELIKAQDALIDVINSHVQFTSDQIERAFDIVDTNLEFQLKNFRLELEEQKALYEEIRDKIHSDLLPDTVKQKLEEWLLNGTIEDMLTGTVLPELMDRIEQVENRVEEKELLQEVNIKDYDYLVEDGNWHKAILQALEDAKTVYFPIGDYTTYCVEINLSNREIKGSGTGTQFTFVRNYEDNSHFHGFRVNGNTEEIRRVTTNVRRHSDTVYLENTSGLNKGDTVIIKSQRNALNYADTGDQWYLGSSTGSQKVPFGEFVTIKEVFSDRVVLSSNLIYPSYMSNNSKESNSAQDFSTVQKVNFVENLTFRDFKVVNMYSGYVVYADTCKNLIMDNVHYDDSTYYYGTTGILNLRNSLSCETVDSTYYTTVGKTPVNIYDMNVFKIANSQNCGFKNCKAENATQSFDLTYFTGGIPNTACYADGCTFVNAMQSGATTHGGNYLTQFVNNKIIGSTQGLSHRGRGALINGNIFIGSSKVGTSRLHCGIVLYEGGATDNVISNNVIRNFNNGVGQIDRSPEEARLRYAGNQITNNNIANCNIAVTMDRVYIATNLSQMGVLIANNHISMSNAPGSIAVYAIRVKRGNNGVTIKDNVIKGIEGDTISFVGDRENNFYGVYADADVDSLRIVGNTFMDIDSVFRHPGRPIPSDFTRSLWVQRENNEYIRIRTGNFVTPGTGVGKYPESAMD